MTFAIKEAGMSRVPLSFFSATKKSVFAPNQKSLWNPSSQPLKYHRNGLRLFITRPILPAILSISGNVVCVYVCVYVRHHFKDDW